MGYILSIDQGTTSSRAIIMDQKANILAIGQKDFTQSYPQPGWVEQDPQEILSSVRSAMEAALQTIDPTDIEAIGITNQRETTILWDRQTGKPIYPAIVWQSRQSDSYCDAIKADGKEDWIHQKTGLYVDPYFCASKILWIFDHVEGSRERARNGEILFGTVDSFLLWHLSGRKKHLTDVTNASRTMLFHLENLCWDKEILDYLDIPEAILPEVVSSSEIYGLTDPDMFFGREVPLASMIGDQQAALFGQACFHKGQVKQTYGTGGFALMQLEDQFVLSQKGLLTTIAWKIGEDISYALEGSVFVAGSLIQWLRDGLRIIQDSSESEELALSVSSCEGVIVVPALVGLGAPYWDDEVRGSILGITRGTQRAHIVRAALESIAFQTADVIRTMEDESAQKIAELRVDGGASRNDFLMQFQADLLHCELERLVSSEATAMGAGFLAGLAVGFWKRKEDLKHLLRTQKTFHSLAAAEDTEMLISRWHKAVEATRSYRP